jgi:hypothetical protein
MRRSSEVGSTHLFSLDPTLHWEEGMVTERFHPSAQEAFELPDWCKEGSLGLPT